MHSLKRTGVGCSFFVFMPYPVSENLKDKRDQAVFYLLLILGVAIEGGGEKLQCLLPFHLVSDCSDFIQNQRMLSNARIHSFLMRQAPADAG